MENKSNSLAVNFISINSKSYPIDNDGGTCFTTYEIANAARLHGLNSIIVIPSFSINKKININDINLYKKNLINFSKFFKEFFELQKVTIRANKNGAGGYTLFTPKDSYSEYPTKRFLLANMIIALGGRAAEVILYNKTSVTTTRYVPDAVFPNINELDITTGASNDLKQANQIARQYVSLFGLGNNIGLYDSTSTAQPFLGRDIACLLYTSPSPRDS